MLPDRTALQQYMQNNYRNELKQEITQKPARTKRRNIESTKESFKLMDNFEREQQKRKHLKDEYMRELREQIELQKNKKKEEENKKKESDLRQQLKIQKQLQQKQMRYKKQLQREKIKQRGPSNLIQNANTTAQNKSQNQQSLSKQFFVTLEQKIFPVIRSFKTQYKQQEINKPYLRTQYMPSEKKFSDNYYQQLIGQRRLLQEQVKNIKEINRELERQKQQQKSHNHDLNDFRALYSFLEQKESNLKRGLYHETLSKVEFFFNKNETSRPIKNQNRKLD